MYCYSQLLKRSFFVVFSAVFVHVACPPRSSADDGYLGTDVPGLGAGIYRDGYVDDHGDVGTATGDILEARGDLARGLGKGALLRSLSVTELQRALRLRLENREERVEQYYELREYRDKMVDDPIDITAEDAREIAARGAPDRLGEHQLDRETGEIYWPSPLDHQSLKPYRKPIEDTFAKRSSPGEKYREWDYLKVHRMVNLIEEALEMIEDQLNAREMVALKTYLTQIDFEARFDGEDERVDF
ncbi:hypothetical protein [Neorhodopirellula pilleata]|uniref:Uncharacterized protein n=1 Tax=Neorhodopirellula pilleata TaxID=2714738 RepID=A0A5C6AMY0_9BACT|nr:hypothetical protein [Neorhodopirellula pilleata]TWU01403.1 hypothetical protein Pla100_11300 [Neorhodopirellula pilleata]